MEKPILKCATLCIANLILLFFVFSLPVYATGEGPTEQLRPTLTKLIDIVRDPLLQGVDKKQERRQVIMTTVSERFDFKEMSKRVLGPTWREIDEKEQEEFTRQMTKLLENNYIGQLENYSGESVEYVGERVKQERAQVSTLIENNGAKYPVHYIMSKEGDKWMVYDINIEGVSLIRNYRAEFNSILLQQNFDGLLQTLIAKNKSFEQE